MESTQPLDQENQMQQFRENIKAEVLCDSVSLTTTGHHRLVTMELTYPKFFHADVMTYRTMSRNAASSRAIPTAKMRRMILDNPAGPVLFRANAKGMAANDALDIEAQVASLTEWSDCLLGVAKHHEELERLGNSKDVCNRILEPWVYITVICTANIQAYQHMLFERLHPAAQMEFQYLAKKMLEALRSSSPTALKAGQWHLPMIKQQDREEYTFDPGSPCEGGTYPALAEISAARCARVSYLTHEGIRDTAEDLEMFQVKLIGSEPGHWSPLEHPAMCTGTDERIGNFTGFKQLRKFYPERENSLYPL